MKMNRRTFLVGAAAAATGALIPKGNLQAAVKDTSYASLIDLTKCDGCVNKGSQACVDACRSGNKVNFPEPDPEKIKDYWPQKKHEDWSNKRYIKNQLTPYNWTFVQKVTVDGENVHIPRRCMHCDNPPCAKLCPFGINHKMKEGPVYIDDSLCFGGAKCRTVCPWDVPQRQAGVGIYTYLQPMPVGGGVMYKCDSCKDLLLEGKTPHCASACPQKAISYGTRKDIFAKAAQLKNEYNGHIYGMDEHGGTSTIYVSKVSFDKIDKAILNSTENPKKTMRMHQPKNMINDTSSLAKAALVAPVAGAVGAFVATTMNRKGDSDE